MENEIELNEEELKLKRKKMLFIAIASIGAIILLSSLIKSKKEAPKVEEKPKKSPRPINVVINNSLPEKPLKSVKNKIKKNKDEITPILEGQNEETDQSDESDDNSEDN